MSSSSPVPPPPPNCPDSPEMSPNRLSRKNMSEFTEEKQLTLVIADLFEGIAQEQRHIASKMKSLRACRNFRVDVRGSNYFMCQCGHQKAKHAFSPLLEEEMPFLGSTGITPKFEVEEEEGSEYRTSVLSFGSDVVGAETPPAVIIPCLDEFRKHFKEKQALQQPRITLSEKTNHRVCDVMQGDESESLHTDRDASSEPGSERHHSYNGLTDSLKAFSLVGMTNEDPSDKTKDDSAKSNQSVAKFLQDQRLKETMRSQLKEEVTAEVQRELNAVMFQKAREFEQEMESRFQDAVLRVEKEQQATLQELDANYRAELESMQEQFMGQLDEIEVNAQAHIEEVKKTYEQSERSKEKRHKDLLSGLKRQGEAQLEELTILRRLRDRQLSSSSMLENNSSNNSGGGTHASGRVSPLRRSSRDLVTQLSQLAEEGEGDEEDDILPSKDNASTVNVPIKKSEQPEAALSKSNDHSLKSRQLFVVFAILFIAAIIFQMGIVSISDFRVKVLRPFVLRVARWLSDVS